MEEKEGKMEVKEKGMERGKERTRQEEQVSSWGVLGYFLFLLFFPPLHRFIINTSLPNIYGFVFFCWGNQ